MGCHQAGNVRRVVLPVRVDGDYHRIAVEGLKAGLQRRALALVLGVTQHLRSSQGCHLGGAVTAAVIDDDDAVGELRVRRTTLPMETSSL